MLAARTVNSDSLAEKMQDMAELVAQMDLRELRAWFAKALGGNFANTLENLWFSFEVFSACERECMWYVRPVLSS